MDVIDILILGKNGFIAKSLYSYFSELEGYNVVCVGSEELNLRDENQTDKFFRGKYYDIILHAALFNPAYYNKETAKYYELEYNLRMFYNVSRQSKAYGRLIYFGSGAEYGKHYNISEISEEDLLSRELPQDQYGLAKWMINREIERSDNIYNLRIFGLYGKYEYYPVKFITGCCAKAVLDFPMTIRKNALFDFLYINDFCEMIRQFIELEKPMYHTYNIASGKKVDLVTLAEIVNKVAGKDLPIYVCQEGMANEYTANADRLQKEIGYFEFVSHEEAIDELYHYFDEHKHEIDKIKLLYQ